MLVLKHQKRTSEKRGGIALKKLALKFGSVIASFALMITALNVNTTCYFLIHQPKLPKGAEKLRRF
jgi:cyclic lactone autoinducer peptide